MWKIMVGGIIMAALVASTAMAEEQTFTFAASDLTSYSAVDTAYGDSYVLELSLPASLQGADVLLAELELYVDVDIRRSEDFNDPAPLLEVYAVNGTVVGALDEELIEPSSALRSVLKGQSRHVRLNVTDIVRDAAKLGSTITGLAVGSFIGEKLGKFTVRSDGFGDGTVAKLRIDVSG